MIKKEIFLIDPINKNDQHLIYNSSILEILEELGYRVKLKVDDSSKEFYQNYLTDSKKKSLQASESRHTAGKRIYLAASWSIIFNEFFRKRKSIIIYHNFFSFVERKTVPQKIKYALFKLHLFWNKKSINAVLKPVIIDSLQSSGLTSKNFIYLPIWYSRNLIDTHYKNVKIPIIESDIIILGNLHKDKVNKKVTEEIECQHFGKIHDEENYPFSSINRYLNLPQYYSILREKNKVLLPYSKSYKLIASGVLADCIAFEKTVIVPKNVYKFLIPEKISVNQKPISKSLIEISFDESSNDLLKKELRKNLRKIL